MSNRSQDLHYPLPVKTTTVDVPLSEPDTAVPVRGIKAVAHTTNDYTQTTGTVLYDLDIASGRSDGVAISNVGYASFTSGGTVQLWTVDLLTGNGHEIGDFPAASSVTEFSVVIR